jgi:tRNA-specific 2-thiouridylase
MTKPEVRKLAAKFKLPNADKKDSQGLCFIGKVDIKEFLRHYIKTKPGNVLNEAGETIGKHPGALLFTIGERHGFTVDSDHKSPDDKAFYVVGKDVNKNTLTVSNKDHSNKTGTTLSTQGLTRIKISRTNWIEDIPPKTGIPIKARSRYRQLLQDIKIISIGADDVEVEFQEIQDTLTPGQSLVIYDGDECLGGGIIEG